jgi:guanylate kinase
MTKTDALLFIVSSPSGAGKTTLCKKLLSEFKNIRLSVSHTTRLPRPNETDGNDYHFIDNATFDKMIEKKQFIEWAHVHGNRYGTSLKEILTASQEGVDLIFDIDYQGAMQIKKNYSEAIGIFVLPPSLTELKRRLNERGTETPQSLEQRFKAALKEISHHNEFDYLLVNDNVDIAYDKLRSIILAEHIRLSRTKKIAEALLKKQN